MLDFNVAIANFMRHVLLILLVTIVGFSYGQTKNSFPFVKFDKVILYDYEPSGEDPSLVDTNEKIISTVKIKKQIQLDTGSISKLNIRIVNKRSYGQVTAMCFEPHLGIVYYLKGKIVRHVLVCMTCNVLRADIDITAQHQNKQGPAEKPYYLGDGMSKSFRNFLNLLLVKYNLSHQIKRRSAFD